MNQLILTLAFIIMNTSMTFAQIQPVTLRVGQPAPPLSVYQWLKGSPVSLEKGQVYVVEFTSVFCGPCRASIPHIARLAKDYKGKATFISAYVWESRSYQPDIDKKDSLTGDYTLHVKKFIHSQGSKFDDIHVALDDPRETIVNTWMFPAGKRGAPVAYVIDQQGNIVWMGNPLELDLVLKQVLEGNFDSAAALRRIVEKKEEGQRIDQYFKTGDTSQAFAILDRWIADNPEEIFLLEAKFKYLLNIDEPRAYAYGRELLKHQCRNSEAVLLYLSGDIVYKEDGVKLIARDYDLGIDIANRAFEISTIETAKAGCIEDIAKCYFLQGNFKKAVQTQRAAIAYLKKHCDMGDPGVQDLASRFDRNLEEYSQKLISR
jgi:thiol-disulfide isomerase/thioredoxin